jgi:GntR family transcriptional repressor for pyruvate dehydrogenase complex
MASFSPIHRASAVDQCEAAIRARILGGGLAPGERLPPERTLSETLGVNRVTLRSALGRLAAARLLAVRQGSGYVVLDYRREGSLALVPELAARGRGKDRRAVAEDLLLVRRHLARAVLDRLSEGVDPRGLPAVDAAIGAFAALVREGAGTKALAAADLEVLRAVVAATRSEVLALCLNPVVAVVEAMPALREAIYADAQESLDGWHALRAWLAAPHAAVVELLMAALAGRDAQTLARLAEPRPARRTP